MRVDAEQDVREVGDGIDFVSVAGGDQRVEPGEVAAGVDSDVWAGHSNTDRLSLGIELVHGRDIDPGGGSGYMSLVRRGGVDGWGIANRLPLVDYPQHFYPQAQITALISLLNELVLWIAAPEDVRPRRIVSHAEQAPSHRTDPGPWFDWTLLEDANLGMRPNMGSSATDGDYGGLGAGWGDAGVDSVMYSGFFADRPVISSGGRCPRRLQQDLLEIGYDVADTGMLDQKTRDAVVAFKSRFFSGWRAPYGWSYQGAIYWHTARMIRRVHTGLR